ncbi:unnamed protein product [Symbiodinium natans]|uniref:Tyrosine-protein kinase ephrin type A/B receptor-like domain-containing protein n=1 Tax=Symbiodinium natans TaxID=878477 RepID=A0A812L0S3_9DINO|nr:unnamed protein product [Symbiodinium natans]
MAACLRDAIDFSQRQNLTRGDQVGESYPATRPFSHTVGLWEGDWAASFVTTAVARILIEERMGYNVVTNGPGTGTVTAFYALVGCLRPNNIADRGCGQTVTHNHVVLEAWPEAYAAEIQEVESLYPSMAPVSLGSMGYDGTTGIFFPSKILDSAYHDAGIALDYFRGWNHSWSESWNYFDNIIGINKSLVLPCNETRFQISKVNEDYLRYTGDSEGVEVLPNGELVAKCFDNRFWLAPGCRADVFKCVPYVTGGAGWWLDDTMQKAAAYDMPLAVGVARDLTKLPFQKTMSFYSWSPDTTFWSLDPTRIIFPPNDFSAHLNGDKRTAGADSLVAKIVSQDLASMAPRLEDLIRSMRFNINDVNAMMGDMLETGDSAQEAACRWLLVNPNSWQSWLPDMTKCFPGFGLYDTNRSEFVNNRDAPTFLECRACESGRFSSRLDDTNGITYECRRCEPGTSQPSGAALQCDKCNPGEFQANTGSKACDRCDIGSYQDRAGSPSCVVCPDGSTTLGLGSISSADCGCEAGFIDQAGDGNSSCVSCGLGLSCPALGSIVGLSSGSSPLGEQFVPEVQKEFYSSPEEPLKLYRCFLAKLDRPSSSKYWICTLPGGPTRDLPWRASGNCLHGLQRGMEGQIFSSGECRDCTVWQKVGWVVGLAMIAVGLVVAYYMLTLPSTAKASVLFTTACSFGLTTSSLQSLGIVGMMTVDFPADLRPFFDFLQIFLLDIDSLAFSCVAGNYAPARYISSVLFFPGVVLWLVACNLMSRSLAETYRWEVSKTCSVAGAILQVGFSTMSTISMAPLMCFSHPNGVHSVLKYPGITCGTADHTAMLVMGLLLLAFGVLGFLVLCTYAVVLAPRWSAQGKHGKVKAFRFLLFRFRLDSWWFGVPLLTRGPLLSLPIALATDYPPIQVMSMAFVFLVFLVLECRAWPWKVPLLNLLDTFLCMVMTMLVGSSSLHLGPIEGNMKDFANVLASILMALLALALAVLLMMTMAALVYRAALGGQHELFFFNLQMQPSSQDVSARLQATAALLQNMKESELKQAIEVLSVYDLGLLLSYVSLTRAEIVASERTGDDSLDKLRIFSNSFAPPKAKIKKMASMAMEAPTQLGRRVRQTVLRLTAEMDSGRCSGFREDPPMGGFLGEDPPMDGFPGEGHGQTNEEEEISQASVGNQREEMEDYPVNVRMDAAKKVSWV